MKKNLPNILTLGRVFAIPVFIACFFIEGYWSNLLTCTIFGLASITDYYDGKLARAYKVQSNFGKCIDPIADKLLVSSAIIMLIYATENCLIIALCGLIIISREIIVSGLREFLAHMKIAMPVTRLAKWKTGIQMAAISCLLLGGQSYSNAIMNIPQEEIVINYATAMNFISLIGIALLVVAAALTAITGYQYLKTGAKYM